MLYKYILFFIFLCGVLTSGKEVQKSSKQNVRKFPDGFLFGTATASYQVEGAWDEDGKSESIWDHLTHTYPCAIKDCSNGDIADVSYHYYKRDVEMLRELGADFYRFSLSWTRILPSSFPDYINEAGVQYYNNLIDELLKYNIQPMVTLYHWDLPQKLQEMGGWTNPHIVDWFGDFARVAFELFGDRVKDWITVNEPREICYQGYGSDKKAPRLNITGLGEYICGKNLLLASARAWHIYDEEFRSKQDGQVSITICAHYYEPESEEHVDAADQYMEFELGMYANPIFGTGDFPQVVKDRMAAKSAEQGYPRSRLPEFTAEEINYLRGSSDLFGLNHYSTYIVYKNESFDESFYVTPSYEQDVGAIAYHPSEWEAAVTEYLRVVPWGFYKTLTRIRERYNNPSVIVTENGFSTYAGLNDDRRINYYRTYLDAMLDAMDEGSNVVGYTAWSLMDNFEWMSGYTERFGLYEVDYETLERTRTPRKSAFVYKEILRTRTLDFSYEPDVDIMTIDEGH